MRLRIRDHKGLHGPLRLSGHNMKLGRGGIREIEFFTQTRQLIAGGRDPELRVRGTVEGLARLADAGWIPEDAARTLSDHYRAHREVEHRLQMVADASRMMRRLDWAPQHDDLDSIVRDALAWEDQLVDRKRALQNLEAPPLVPSLNDMRASLSNVPVVSANLTDKCTLV